MSTKEGKLIVEICRDESLTIQRNQPKPRFQHRFKTQQISKVKKFCHSEIKLSMKMAIRILMRRPIVRIVPQIRCFSSTKPEKSIILETDAKTGISTMILNRPPVNSLGMNFMQEIIQTVDTLV